MSKISSAIVDDTLAPLATVTGAFEERIQRATSLTLDEFDIAFHTKPTRGIVEASIHNRCNQSCNHCFMLENDEHREVSPQEVLAVFQHLDPVAYEMYPYPLEPLLLPEMFPVYKAVGAAEISTNATHFREHAETLDALRAHGIKILVVSLHGNEQEHCELTNVGPEVYQDLVQSLRRIVSEGFQLQIITTLYKGNINALDHLPELLIEIGASHWYIHRVIPTGAARSWPMDQFLYGDECKKIMLQYARLRQKYQPDQLYLGLDLSWGPNYYSASVLRYLAGQRQRWPQTRYGCPAITHDYLAVSMDSRRVYPCFHLESFPEAQIGTLRADSSISIDRQHFGENALLQNLRGKCGECAYKRYCLGGCRAAAFSFAAKQGNLGQFFAGQDFCLTQAIEEDLAELAPEREIRA